MEKKWKNNEPREYYSKYKKLELKNNQNWFEAYELPNNIIGICEPNQFQEVNIFLIKGKQKAILLDTGMGIAKIKPVVEELFSGEIIVINSHFHFDHIANNSYFEQVHAYSNPLVLKVAEQGLPKEALGNQLEEIMFRYGYPKDFDPNLYHINPYKLQPLLGGEIFNLGDRDIEVIHTPGHSQDSIMLFDHTYGCLFTGDTFYLGALYAHFNCEEFGHFDMKEYIESLKKVAILEDKISLLYCSHRDFTASKEYLKMAADALESIYNGDITVSSQVSESHTYLEDGMDLTEYFFNGFSVICSLK